MASPDEAYLKYLEGMPLDRRTNLLWINPSLLAEEKQDFLIYSPAKSGWLVVPKSAEDLQLQLHEERSCNRNLFRLEKAEGENLYYLLNKKSGKYISVSGEHVFLGKKHESNKEQLQVLIEKYGKTTLYTIKNRGLHLFVSENKAGSPPCRVVQAAETVDECLHVFEFVLEKEVQNAKIEYDLSSLEKVSNNWEHVHEFENDTEEQKREEVEIEDPSKNKVGFQFERGFGYFGQYTGGTPVEVEREGGRYVAIAGKEMKKSTEEKEKGMAFSYNIGCEPKHKITMKCQLNESYMVVPFTIKVKTGFISSLTGSGTWIGNYHVNAKWEDFSEDMSVDQAAVDGGEKESAP